MKLLRRLLDWKLSWFEEGKPFGRMRPLISALDTFCFEAPNRTHTKPFIRDAADVKRWMFLVVVALLPAILMAIWNTGVQKMVYESGQSELMRQFLESSSSFKGYFNFTFSEGRYLTILKLGALAFLPVMLISYAVGGLVEGIIACIRGHEIAEGFLVTGMLYPLILPPTIPYWMVALGIVFGVVIGKEIFGGTGMNILNPALVARSFLFFTFPGKMTGDIWVGTNPSRIATSLSTMNTQAGLSEVDGYSQATPLGTLNTAVPEIKRVHVDAIATNWMGSKVSTYPVIEGHFAKWSAASKTTTALGQLSGDEMRAFLSAPLESGGLGLAPGNFVAAHQFAETSYGDKFSDGNLFFGNMLGSMGETSVLACLLGALFLVYVGVGAWRTMVAVGLFAFLSAYFFEFFSTHVGADGGAWNAAKYAYPAYRHLMVGGLAFGLVFMATDPVSAPSLNLSKWIYGGLIGVTTILIRLINPAFPEGVMLAILFANVFSPLIDTYVLHYFRRVPRAQRARA